MKSISRIARMSFFAIFVCLIFSASWLDQLKPQKYGNGVDENGKKIYAGKTPITNSPAYQQFKFSSQSELEKLYYFRARLVELDGFYFRMQGGRYTIEDAQYGTTWLISHRYTDNESARKFIEEQLIPFETPAQPLLIEFPNGSLQRVVPVALNELELLEDTIKKDTSGNPAPHKIKPAGQPTSNSVAK